MNSRMMSDWTGHGGNDYINIYFENALVLSAARSLATMKAYVDFRRQGFDIKAIRYEDLVARPLETCERLMEACGLPVSLAHEVVKCMQHDSQKNTEHSRERLRRFRDPEVTPEIIESMNRLAAKYGLPPVSEECILEGTMS